MDDVLPFIEQIQTKIAALAARHPQWMPRFGSSIRPQHFQNQHLRLIYDWISDLWDNYRQTISKEVLFDRLHAWMERFPNRRAEADPIGRLIWQLYSDDLSDAAYIADQVQKFVSIQEYKLATLEAIKILNEGGDEAKLPAVFNKVQVKLSQQIDHKYIDLMNPDHLAAMFREPVRQCFPTPWPSINRAIGGPARQELLTIMAAPSAGKSFSLSSIGLAGLMTGAFVYHATLEMSDKITAIRYLSGLFGVPTREVEANYKYYVQSVMACRLPGRVAIRQYPTGQMTIEDLRQGILHIATVNGRLPDIVIVDYLDLAAPEDAERRDLELSRLYTEFRGMAVEMNFAGVTVSQVKQSAVGRDKIYMKDLAEAFSKAAISDTILALCIHQDQRVLTDAGPIKISELRNSAKKLKVLSHNFRTGQNEWKPLVRWYNNGLAASDGFIRVRTTVSKMSSGSVTTPDHHYFLPDGRTVEARQVRVGQHIVGLDYCLSQEQKQVILGSLLGDGYIGPGPSGHFQVMHGSKQKYYATWKLHSLKEIARGLYHSRQPASYYRGYKLKEREAYSLCAKNGWISELRDIFYPEDKKIAPRSVLQRLTPLGIACWLMDDGCIRTPYRDITLATQGFDEDSRHEILEFFIGLGWEARIQKSGVLRFTTKSSHRILRELSSYIRPSQRPAGSLDSKRFLCPTIPHGNYGLAPVQVVSIDKPNYKKNRYRIDIEVEDNHNFYLASGVLVSNCITPEEEPLFNEMGQLLKPGTARWFVAKNRNEIRGQIVKLKMNVNVGRIDEDMPTFMLPQQQQHPQANLPPPPPFLLGQHP